MRDMNKTIFTGRLTADPETRALPNGTPHCGVSVAVNSQKKKGDTWTSHVDYIEVAIYGKQAENLAKYLRKGSPVLIEGRLAQQRWEDKQTGQKRSKLGVVAETVQFLGSGRSDRGPEYNPEDLPPAVGEAFTGAEQVGDGEIPF